MKKSSTFLIGFVILSVVAMMTNPSLDSHKEEVKSVISKSFEKSLSDSGNSSTAFGTILGSSFIGMMVESMVTRENYVIFSLTNANYQGNKKTIGFGVFGLVFISEKVTEALDSNRK
jgi:hypothetical protein